MSRLIRLFLGALLIAGSASTFAADPSATNLGEKPLNRAQALRAVNHMQPEIRLAAIQRLGVVGTMGDANKLVVRLHDVNTDVREMAVAAIWSIWSRSGDREIDALYRQGIQQMQGSNLDDALTTFTEITKRKPDFAEGWNKRATILYIVGEHRQSLKDCEEVLKRNPNHFGALSGMAQIHILLGHPEHALEAYERALKINPNLPDADQNLKTMREAVAAKRQKLV
ncbi:MAG: tetratricopeptide repeat protein [Casimicrobiaceae bacterium]